VAREQSAVWSTGEKALVLYAAPRATRLVELQRCKALSAASDAPRDLISGAGSTMRSSEG
jgi:hypothetical protein